MRLKRAVPIARHRTSLRSISWLQEGEGARQRQEQIQRAAGVSAEACVVGLIQSRSDPISIPR